MLLKPPFDPFVEEVKDERGDYVALRSSAFDGMATSQEVHQAAKQLFSTLNVAMSTNADTDPITNGAVIEFVPDGQPRKHHYLEPKSITMRARIGIPEMTLKDAQGNVIEPTPAPSRAQLWMRAAALGPEIGSALRYLEGKPGWFELYKAYEAVRSTEWRHIERRDQSLYPDGKCRGTASPQRQEQASQAPDGTMGSPRAHNSMGLGCDRRHSGEEPVKLATSSRYSAGGRGGGQSVQRQRSVRRRFSAERAEALWLAA
jgi:hypothetical protein